MGVEKTGLLSNCWKFTSNKILFFKNPDKRKKALLFEDDYMKCFIDADIERLAKEKLPEPMTLALAVRHKYFNKIISKTIKDKEAIKQVVFLGSGYDTRPVRKRKYSEKFGVTFFEVDFPEVLENKEAIYSKSNIQKNAVYIGCNYLDENFVDVLRNYGVRFDVPTHFVWEGNTMYIPKQHIANLLTLLHKNFTAHLFVSFDYFHESIVSKTPQLPGATKMLENFDKMNASMITGYNNIKDILADVPSFTVIEDSTVSAVANSYEIQNDFPKTASLYSVCTLKK